MPGRPHSREKKIVDKSVRVEKRPISSSKKVNNTAKVVKGIFGILKNEK